jgi:hypothetical protein
LAAVVSVKFFEQSNPVAALLSTIALFTAGFQIRPLGGVPVRLDGRPVGRKSYRMRIMMLASFLPM